MSKMPRTPSAPSGQEVLTFVRYLDAHATGKKSAILARDLGKMLGIERDARRKLRALASAAVEAGYLVCATNDGYFIPASRDEAMPGLLRLRAQCLTGLSRAHKLERLIAQAFGDVQLKLEAK